jgi:hypothetical protein
MYGGTVAQGKVLFCAGEQIWLSQPTLLGRIKWRDLFGRCESALLRVLFRDHQSAAALVSAAAALPSAGSDVAPFSV